MKLFKTLILTITFLPSIFIHAQIRINGNPENLQVEIIDNNNIRLPKNVQVKIIDDENIRLREQIGGKVIINLKSNKEEPEKQLINNNSIETSTLNFLNGDVFHGNLISIDPKNGLVWQYPDAKQPITLQTKNVYQINLKHQQKILSNSSSKILLSNGNTLYGTIISLNQDNLILETCYADKLTIKKSMITGIIPNTSKKNHIFAGPNNKDEWEYANKGEDKWELKNGMMISKEASGFGKEIKLEDCFSIEFWYISNNNPNFHLSIASDKLVEYGSNSYSLQVSGTYVSVTRYKKEKNTSSSSSFKNFHIRNNLNKRGKNHYKICVNRKKKSIMFFINGEFSKEIIDHQKFAGIGNKIIFWSRTKGIAFSNIIVKKWDGTTILPNNAIKNLKDKDRIFLKNKNKISGEIITIIDNIITMKTDYATMPIPLEKIHAITLAVTKQTKPRRQKNDMKLRFYNGGYITFNLLDAKNNILNANSDIFGNAKFKLNSFNQLQMNIYDKRIPTKKKKSSSINRNGIITNGNLFGGNIDQVFIQQDIQLQIR